MSATPTPLPNPKRTRLLVTAATVFVLLGIAYAAWWFVYGSHFEDTDDAYVHGNLVQITPQIAGTVIAIDTDDTRTVKVGQPLVRIDPADADVALAKAEAQLAQTVRQVRTRYVQNDALAAQVEVRQAEIGRAQADLARAQSDFKRRQALSGSGGVSGEELLHADVAVKTATSNLAQAKATLTAAQAQLATNLALTHGTTIEQHPDVRVAAAAVRAAWLAKSRTVLPAPVDGVVARRSVQVGQRVAPGSVLMNVVPLNQVWVEANFKEGQLRKMKVGQPATIKSDLYGSSVTYHGIVVGMDAGTGSAFALLPAQNATGNWIKVVQRVPVRVAIDPDELKQHPLRVGLSLDVEVDTAAPGNAAKAEKSQAALSTPVFDESNTKADALISSIIKANLQ
ncbi:HlyD family efflux transporter periplasmic adaptor subunit [Bordetella sp. FB-8]|uniref:HlyD family secretion protein n=1 Tax=Bordetella sp. FB-8 TaxID=1159870 RepID=UPI00037402DF|nr:HlyD family efflux transporter periplasmic adaptor subunit [Bordetella sp. FB-8]